MSDTTNPGGEAAAEVVSVPAEQDFSAFENSLADADIGDSGAQAEPETPDFADDDTPEGESPEASDDGDDDFEEIEHKGKKYRVPKGAALMQADYTRKTQEVAELRKRFSELTTAAEEASEAETRTQLEYLEVARDIAEYETYDWDLWRRQDPIAAMQGQIDYQQALQRQQRLGLTYQQAREQRLALAQQETATRLAEGQKVLASKIPDWGETKQRQIIEHTMNAYGFEPADLAAIDDPRVILVMHDALQFAAMSKKQQAAAKVAQAQAVQPVRTLKGNNARSGPRADTNDFLAFERLANAKLAKR